MRVAIVVERFIPETGGVERAAYELVRQLAMRDHDVTVVCHQHGDAELPGVEIRRLNVPAFWQPLRIRRFSKLAAEATHSGFDVVHAFARTRHQSVYRAGGGSHAAYLERAHARPALRARLSPRHRAILGIEEAVFRDPEQLIQTNARHTAREIRERYRVPDERLVTIYNGVDAERFHPEKSLAQGLRLRRELALRGPVALFAGDGFARKGLDRAIRALAKAPASAKLLVAGSDDPKPYEQQAQKLRVADRVLFLGRRNDLPALHAASDLFILPTRYDAFSNACLEAMASGLPVATTRANGVAEVIVSGVNGWLCDEDFTPALRTLDDMPSLERLGRAARETAENLTWTRHAQEVLAMYERLRR